MEVIDFILPWVDGNDSKWRSIKNYYEKGDHGTSSASDANSDCRYRDNGLLRYWFRGVEKFAPWVNKIHFVTCGQRPIWLNTNHPKLHWVKHSDFIPEKYLPTFNANTIEMNFHRIKNLSEHYVYFNDDIFLLKELNPDFYFKNRFPVLDSDLRYTKKVGYNNWSRLLFNDYCLVNNSFDIKSSIWSNRKKWFSVKALGFERTLKNILCYFANYSLPVSLYGHVALPHLKSTLKEIWDLYPSIMAESSSFKFRSDSQVNQWLLCAWNQAKGCFSPSNINMHGRQINICPKNIPLICDIISRQLITQICLNESEYSTQTDYCYEKIAEAFDKILPRKSSFELNN